MLRDSSPPKADRQDDFFSSVVMEYWHNSHQPSIATLREIAKALDVDVRELLMPTKP